MRDIIPMKIILSLILGMVLISGCVYQNADISSGIPELIRDFNQNVNSKGDAINLLQNWLNDETDFDSKTNKIGGVDDYSDYYILRLTTATRIEGRERGVLGYRDYKISRDGKLYGYYYSK